jgi:hypothetical protein
MWPLPSPSLAYLGNMLQPIPCEGIQPSLELPVLEVTGIRRKVMFSPALQVMVLQVFT